MKNFWTVVFALMFLALTAAATVNAAPFLSCGPYPLEESLTDTDPPTPEYFVIVFDNAPPVTVTPTVLPAPDGRIYLSYDLGAVAKGKHVAKIKAGHSIWGESAEVPFTFRAGTPLPASGVKLQK